MLLVVLASLLLWACILAISGTGFWPILVWIVLAIVVGIAVRQIDPDWPIY